MRRPLSAATTVVTAVLAVLNGHVYTSAITAQPTRVRVVTIHRHDTSAFTEGLFFHGDALVESTGLNGQSFIRQYRLPAQSTAATLLTYDGGSGDKDASSSIKGAQIAHVQREFRFDTHMFGEGVANIGDTLYALTYKAKAVLELSLSNFTLLGTHPITTTTGEGWGMTTDGALLIVSDGSATIQFFDPRAAFALVRSVTVRDHDGAPVPKVNELEWVPDANEILANVWFKNHILRINATDGTVLEVIDLAWLPNMVSNLATPAMQHSPLRNDAVMNGIALHPVTRHVFVTGKLWDSVFELEFSYLSTTRRSATDTRNGSRTKQRHEQ